VDDLSGSSVSSAGDVNGDGLDDLIVGAWSANAGKSYVIFGKTDTGAIDLSKSITSMSWMRLSLDGLDDLIIGAYGADPSGKSSAGKSYIVFGKQDTLRWRLSDHYNYALTCH
jgi:hypothetical protein